MSEHIVEITQENAQTYLIEESSKRPVLIDFWADWCAPCKSLMPILEKLAIEYQGQFLLAKVNSDEQQMIAAQFGVRSLPTVMLMKDGQPVDGFAGAQPETQVRELLEKYLPKPWDTMHVSAKELINQGRHSEALPILKQAYEESSQQADIAFTYVDVLIDVKRLDDAETVIDAIKMVDQQSPEYEHVKAQLELAQQAGKAPEVEALEKAYAEDSTNKEIGVQLAVQYSQHQYYKEALEILIGILQDDINFGDGEAKKVFLDVIALLGKGDPVAVEYQRKFYTLLY